MIFLIILSGLGLFTGVCYQLNIKDTGQLHLKWITPVTSCAVPPAVKEKLNYR